MRDSKSLFQAASRVIPGGVNSPVRAFKAVGGVPQAREVSAAPRFWGDGRDRIERPVADERLIIAEEKHLVPLKGTANRCAEHVLPELRLHYHTVGEASGEPVLILHGTGGSGAGMLTSAFAG